MGVRERSRRIFEAKCFCDDIMRIFASFRRRVFVLITLPRAARPRDLVTFTPARDHEVPGLLRPLNNSVYETDGYILLFVNN